MFLVDITDGDVVKAWNQSKSSVSSKDCQGIHLLLFAAFSPKKASQCLNKLYAFKVRERLCQNKSLEISINMNNTVEREE